MFALLRYAYRKLTYERVCSVTIVGLDNAGKTTIFNDLRMILGRDTELETEIKPTIGQNVCKGSFMTVGFTVRDVAGTQRFRKYWKDSFKQTDIVVFVIDSSNQERFVEALEEFTQLLLHPSLIYAPVCVLAHKQDVEGAASDQEIGQLLRLDSVKDRPHALLKSSCRGDYGSHYGVRAMMDWATSLTKTNATAKRRSDYVAQHKDDPDEND